MSKHQQKTSAPVGYLTKQRGQYRTKDRRRDDELGNHGPKVKRDSQPRTISANDAYDEYLRFDDELDDDFFPDDEE